MSPPGWSRWSIGGALAIGFVLPSVLAAIVTVAGYFPIGSALPGGSLWADLGVSIAIVGAGILILIAAPLYSLLAWSWRPLVLALLLGMSAIVGSVPAVLGAQQLRLIGFEIFSRRNVTLIEAIEAYAHATGAAPVRLEELVPTYLTSIPDTGMAIDPTYHYEPNSGPCSERSKWHLWVSVQEFLDLNRLLYCPSQDYRPAIYPVLSRTAIGAWVCDNVNF